MRNCFAWLAYRTRNIHNNYKRVSTLCESEIVLRGWLIDRGTFKITVSAFLLGVKAHLFCIDVLFYWYQSYHWYQWTIGIALYPARSHGRIIKVPLMRCIFTNRTIRMTSFFTGTNRTIATNGPSELACTQPGHMGK